MRFIRTLPAVTLALLAALALSSCGKHAPLAPDTAGSARSARSSTAIAVSDGAQHVEGRTGPGSTYALDVPADWNGDLVLYAHGVVFPASLPVSLPNNRAIVGMVMSRGFAVATSSFDENGYAVKDGVQRTHQLVELFTLRFGAPRHVYLVGRSLGGIIALDLAESYPDQFAGALSLSGVTGGSPEELDYAANVRVLFDLFYPHVLPGTLYDVPPITNMAALYDSIGAAMQRYPQGAGMIAALEPRLPHPTPAQIGTSIVYALTFQLLGASDMTDRLHAHGFFDNHDKVYTGPLPQAALDFVNANVARYTADPSAVNYVRKYYTPSGDLRVPFLSVHQRWDPMVPATHEAILAQLVAGQGRAAMLRQHLLDTYGHDAYTTDQIAVYFDELITWAQSSQPQP